ncbi:MAG: hypothetical protein ACE5JG_06245 [Planctomycetota bacterium]
MKEITAEIQQGRRATAELSRRLDTLEGVVPSPDPRVDAELDDIGAELRAMRRFIDGCKRELRRLRGPPAQSGA